MTILFLIVSIVLALALVSLFQFGCQVCFADVF